MFLYELNRLFSDVVHPGYKGLADSYPNEWESTLEVLAGKHWQTVKFEDFDSQGGIDETVSVLSLKGFIYFLPGLIRLALTEPECGYAVANVLSQRFTLPQPPAKSKPLAKRRHLIHLAETGQLLAALTTARREFLMRVLAAIKESEPHLCPVIVDSAIFNLKVGDAIPYRHEDVQQWVVKCLHRDAPQT